MGTLPLPSQKKPLGHAPYAPGATHSPPQSGGETRPRAHVMHASPDCATRRPAAHCVSGQALTGETPDAAQQQSRAKEGLAKLHFDCVPTARQ
jgi:hypothetical protein